MTDLLFENSEWNFDLLQKSLDVVESIGKKELGMNLYPNQIEIISSSQMLDAYASIGMGVMYNHWSFGKRLIRDSEAYKKGRMGLALEIVVNQNPCVAYLMEENSMTMQLLVLAHASVGHNFCFANNYMFKKWTDAESILDYLSFAKKYILECEAKYGVDEVEKILDSCHTLQNYGVDRYKRSKLSAKKEKERQAERLNAYERTETEFWRTMVPTKNSISVSSADLQEPEENILYFIEKNSPVLKPWQREIVRIVRKLSQYWYPQRFTKTLNEGIATYTHHWILNHMFDHGLINDATMMEWISSHSGVIYQPPFDSKYYSGINPYALGFAIYRDIERICTNPTDEDREWFPNLVGEDYKSVIREATTDYRDDSFIAQFLSPKVARDLKLFGIKDDKNADYIEVNAIHNETTFATLRTQLSSQYDLHAWEPSISVVRANLDTDRALYLEHQMYDNRKLDKQTNKVMAHIRRLWGFPVYLKTVDQNGRTVQSF